VEDLNDIYFFASVVQYGGFSAAARTIGVEKTRLSRRVAALEKRLGVRLLQRTTRALALTEAGQRFFERCVATVEGAQAAYDSVAELRREPAGLVQSSAPDSKVPGARTARLYEGESKSFYSRRGDGPDRERD
jgi:DNA-binding transcriptional LysR family regulator